MHSRPSWWSCPPQESSSPRSSQGDHCALQHRSASASGHCLSLAVVGTAMVAAQLSICHRALGWHSIALWYCLTEMPETGSKTLCSALSTGNQSPVSGSPSIPISFLTLYHSQQTPHCNPYSSALIRFSSLVCCVLLPPSDWRTPAAQEEWLYALGQVTSTTAERSACAATLLSCHVLSCFWGGCVWRYHWEVFNWAWAHCMPGALESWAFKLHNFNWTLGNTPLPANE